MIKTRVISTGNINLAIMEILNTYTFHNTPRPQNILPTRHSNKLGIVATATERLVSIYTNRNYGEGFMFTIATCNKYYHSLKQISSIHEDLYFWGILSYRIIRTKCFPFSLLQFPCSFWLMRSNNLLHAIVRGRCLQCPRRNAN